MKSELTPEEIELGKIKGKERNDNAIKAKADQHKHGFQGDNLKIHIEGVWAEIAAAKALGLKWDDGPWRRFSHDVGELQIRSTPRDDGRLILRPKKHDYMGDADDDIFVLVIAIDQSHYELRGWLLGKDGKKPMFWFDKNQRDPAWFAPQFYLNPMQSPLPDEYFETYPGMTPEILAEMTKRYQGKIELSLPRQLRTPLTIPFMIYGSDTITG